MSEAAGWSNLPTTRSRSYFLIFRWVSLTADTACSTDEMAESSRQYARGLRWGRGSRERFTEPPVIDEATLLAGQVRQHLLLSNVRCTFDGPADSIAATATTQLELINDSEHEIEYQVESVKVMIQHRLGEASSDAAPVWLVAPGEATDIRCPPIRAVDRTGPSSGTIDYVIVYGHPDAPAALRYRRQQGVWFRFEPADDTVRVRFVERYDEDDPAT